MKLLNQFNIIPRYLTAFNYAGLKLNDYPKELAKYTPKFKNFWTKNAENILQIKIVWFIVTKLLSPSFC